MNDLTNPHHPLVEGAPRHCLRCAKPLCLRKQVVNLALGITDEMCCLSCLAVDNDQSCEALLAKMIDYINTRECFAKEWQRYTGIEFCPDPDGCIPAVCFPADKS